MSDFANYVKGKKVVIVGPAGYMKDLVQGDLIDSYDIVVRLNSAVPIPDAMKSNVGSRTDVLSNCLHPSYDSGGAVTPKIWHQHGVKWLLSPYPRSLSYVQSNFNSFISKNSGLLRVVDTPVYVYDKVKVAVNTRPNSGVLTIAYFLSLNISELYVTGFSFGRDGYYPGYKSSISTEAYKKLANSSIHQQEPQLKYAREIFATNPKFKADRVLTKLLQEK